MPPLMLRLIQITVIGLALVGCAALDGGVVVKNERQAIELVRAHELKLYRQMYGRDTVLPPPASAGKPYMLEETRDYFRIEYRKPFLPNGGGYVKRFVVYRKTGVVATGVWEVGR
jgi:hypothetical protein